MCQSVTYVTIICLKIMIGQFERQKNKIFINPSTLLILSA